MILNRFAKLLPGETYKKKLFYWNLIQTVGYWLFFYVVWYPLVRPAIEAISKGGTIENWFWFFFGLPVSEFLSNDGHVWGDLFWIFTGVDLRGIIWMFSMPAITILSYLWAHRNSRIAKYLRTFSYLVALSAYLIYTIFFTWDPRYDYFIWLAIIYIWNWAWWVIVIAIVTVAMMWFGVIVSNGYLIWKAWKEE